MEEDYKISINTFVELNRLLDEMVKNEEYLIQYGEIRIYNKGTEFDTQGKREVFKIIREVKQC